MNPGPLSSLRRRATAEQPAKSNDPRQQRRRSNVAADRGQSGSRTQRVMRSRATRDKSRTSADWALARWAAGLLGELLRRAGDRQDTARLWGAAVIGVVGALLLGVAGSADTYLHRGVETGSAAPFVQHPVGYGLATNADLMTLPADERQQTIAELQGYGFMSVRLPVSWAELEPSPGRFDWDDFDQMLSDLEEADLTPVIVLWDTPDWARGEGQEAAADAPPENATDIGGFVEAFATRFSGRIPFLQIGDRPNDPMFWGGARPDPVAYTTMLGEAANAVRQTSRETRIVLAELAQEPTDGTMDVEFLRAVYDAGGEPFFEVVAAVADGGDRSPFDRQVEPERTNFSRAVLFREVMLEVGDAETPVWATSFGWATRPGGITATEQADFTVAAIDRARVEWPWMGLMFAWDYAPGTTAEDTNRALTRDDQPTTTLLTMTAQADNAETLATTGYTPLSAGAIVFDGAWVSQDTGVGYQSTSQNGARATITFQGSGLIAYVRLSPDAGIVRVTLDGGPVPGLPIDPESDGTASLWDLRFSPALNSTETLVSGLQETDHVVTMELVDRGQFSLGGVVVTRDVPTLWPIVVLAGAGAVLLFIAVRELLYVLGWRSGFLRRRREVELNRPDAW